MNKRIEEKNEAVEVLLKFFIRNIETHIFLKYWTRTTYGSEFTQFKNMTNLLKNKNTKSKAEDFVFLFVKEYLDFENFKVKDLLYKTSSTAPDNFISFDLTFDGFVKTKITSSINIIKNYKTNSEILFSVFS